MALDVAESILNAVAVYNGSALQPERGGTAKGASGTIEQRPHGFSMRKPMPAATAHLEIPQDVLDSARLTADQLLVELAVHLYAQGRLSLGKAHELAGLSLWEFRQILGLRRIAPHFDTEDLEQDLETLRQLDRQ
jgi:predicted HTH domain antitoxin